MYIVTTILAAVGLTVSVPKVQEESSDKPEETSVTQQLKIEETVKENEKMSEENIQSSTSSVYTLNDGVVIEITPAVSGGKISSPLSIKGNVPGSAPKVRYTIRVLDPSGKAVVNSSVSSSSGGNSSSNFTTNLNFSTSSGGTGSLQISSDNGDNVTIPVEF